MILTEFELIKLRKQINRLHKEVGLSDATIKDIRKQIAKLKSKQVRKRLDETFWGDYPTDFY